MEIHPKVHWTVKVYPFTKFTIQGWVQDAWSNVSSGYAVCVLSLVAHHFGGWEIVRETTFHILYPGLYTSVQTCTPTSFLHNSAQFWGLHIDMCIQCYSHDSSFTLVPCLTLAWLWNVWQDFSRGNCCPFACCTFCKFLTNMCPLLNGSHVKGLKCTVYGSHWTALHKI